MIRKYIHESGVFNERKAQVTLTVVICRTSDNLARKKPEKNGVPKGIRTPVAAVKGRSPGPLDDGDVEGKTLLLQSLIPGSENYFLWHVARHITIWWS